MELGTMETGWCAYTYELTDARGHQGNENLEPQRDCTRRGNLAVRERTVVPPMTQNADSRRALHQHCMHT